MQLNPASALALALALALAAPPAWAEGYLIRAWPHPLFQYPVDGGGIEGLGIDLYREIFAEAKVPVSFGLMPYKRSILELQDKPGTCYSAVFKGRFPENQVAWIFPIGHGPAGLWSLADRPVKADKVADLDTYYIIAQSGQVVASRIAGLGLTVDLDISDLALAPQMMVQGRADLLAADIFIIAGLSEASGLKFNLAWKLFEEELWLVCHRDTPTTDILRLREGYVAAYRKGAMDRMWTHKGMQVFNREGFFRMVDGFVTRLRGPS